MPRRYVLLAALLTCSSALVKDAKSAADASTLALESEEHVLTNESTCGLAGGRPGCERSDMGSCGTACCLLDVTIPHTSAEEVYQSVRAFLESRGPSGSYQYVTDWHPSPRELANDHEGHYHDNLTDFPMPWRYVFLGRHTTAVRRYNDTLSFGVRATTKGTILRSFSKSDQSGALGDNGQNYKTLSYMLDHLGYSDLGVRAIFGCPVHEPRNLLTDPHTSNISSCLLNMSKDCDKKDWSSCGSACCVLDAEFEEEPTAVYESARRFLESGGDSTGGNGYYYNGGEMPFNEHLPDDLRPLNMSFKYIFQGIHKSSGEAPGWNRFDDNLNFNLRPRAGGKGTVMRAFSISDVGGDVCDWGQNYKTLAFMLDALGNDRHARRVVFGCSELDGLPADAPGVYNLSVGEAPDSSANPLFSGGKVLLSLAIAGLAAF